MMKLGNSINLNSGDLDSAQWGGGSLLNMPPTHAGYEEKQVQQGNELSGAAIFKVHGIVPHDMSSGSRNLHSKFHIGNSSWNFNQGLLNGEPN
jgi:hypothetical protein